MPVDDKAARTGSEPASGIGPEAAPGTKPAPTPTRPPAEILRDIEAERAGLTEAVASLRQEVDATRAKILSKRTLGIVVGSVATILLVRRRRRRHRS